MKMKTFEVYKLAKIEPVKAKGCAIWDKNDTEYLDLYGGHAVISIGHSHPVYTGKITDQLAKIGFYSNAVENSLQEELASKLGELSGYPDYSLFLCNSGAEANENALKLASFLSGKKRVIAFKEAFHGRTSGAVAATDNPKIQSPFNQTDNIKFLPLNDSQLLETELKTGEYAAVIIEGIQGVAGIYEPEAVFLKHLRKLCDQTGTVLIIDEVQSGYGRTGKFFAHQHSEIRADIITTAKGMGNGFPIGGVLISTLFKPVYGMLGTTFGGNHLACAAAIAVLDVIKQERLIDNSEKTGNYLLNKLKGSRAIKDLRGRGLIIGIELHDKYLPLRDKLMYDEKIFTGTAKSNIIRLLPPLSLSIAQADKFLEAFNRQIEIIDNE